MALLSPAVRRSLRPLFLLFLFCWLILSGQVIFKNHARTDLVTLRRRKVSMRGRAVDGLGVQFFADGTCYAGDFLEGIRTGRGMIVSELLGERCYGGEWVGGRPEGHGVEVLPATNSLYKGQFLQGTRAGYGSMENDDGLYVGQWLNGTRHGLGRLEQVEGSCYEGDFSNDTRHGFGAFLNSNGDKYEGSWSGNEMDGYGVHSREDNGVLVQISGKWTQGTINEDDHIPILDPRIEGAVEGAREAVRNFRQSGEMVLEAVAEADIAYAGAQIASSEAYTTYFLTGGDNRNHIY